MSKTVRIRTERHPALHDCGPHRGSAPTTTTFPGLVRGVSFDASAPSRREALQQFHRLEMMVEAEERLRAESGLVLSDTEENANWCDSAEVGESRHESAAAAALHDAREQLAGRTLHADPYFAEDIWSKAALENQLEEGQLAGEDGDMLFASQGMSSMEPNNSPEADTHSNFMDDLGKLHSRIQQARTVQYRRRRRCHVLHSSLKDDGGGGGRGGGSLSSSSEVSMSSNEDVEFDPERYVAPLLRHCGITEGDTGLWVHKLSSNNNATGDGNRGLAHSRGLHDLLPDNASVQEALRLLEYSVNSNRPDVRACVRRCQEEQRQHHPMTIITNLPPEASETKKHGKNEMEEEENNEEQATLSRYPRREKPPSAETLAEMIAKTLPAIPDELRNELMDQRRLLERLAAAQEASLRQRAREEEGAARRRIMAPRTDYTLGPLASSWLQKSEPFEIAEALRNVQEDPKRPLPPVITISTMRPQPVAASPSAPFLPPRYIEDELKRLHRQYENLLRDERRAWTDIMQKQKEAFQRDKAAAMESLRQATDRRQYENTEEIKRAISQQEIRHRRWEHAAETKRRMAFQQMLYKALPTGEHVTDTSRGGMVATFTPKDTTRRRRPQKPREPLQNLSEEEEGEEKDVKSKKQRKKTDSEKKTIVKGPFSVVLPKEEMDDNEGDVGNLDNLTSRVDEVVLLSDNDEKDKPQKSHAKEVDDSQTLSYARRKTFPLPTTKRGNSLRPYRSPYAASPPKFSASATKKRNSASTTISMKGPRKGLPHSRGAKSQSPSARKEGSPNKSKYAFEVHDARSHAEKKFDNIVETAITESSHLSEERFPYHRPPMGEFSHLHECVLSKEEKNNSDVGKAIFPSSVLLFSDPLTHEELEKRRDVDRAFTVALLPPPPPASSSGESGKGIQRPCDFYYFGDERGDLTPRRRAKLRVAEAQIRREARCRLDQIKSLSMTSQGQKLGEPSPAPFEDVVGGVGEQDFADLLANETIHSIIGAAAEENLFSVLLKDLEDDLVSAALRRLTSKDSMGDTEENKQQDAKEHEEEIRLLGSVPTEQVAVGSNLFNAPVNEESSLEGTILHLIEESMIESLIKQQQKQMPENETDEGSSAKKDEKKEEQEKEELRKTVLLSKDQGELLSDVMRETERGSSVWVHETVSATTDPLWRAPAEEKEVGHVPGAAPTLTTRSENPPGGAPQTAEWPLVERGSPPQAAGFVLSTEGAASSVVPDSTGTIRIVLDVAPIMQQLSSIGVPALPQSGGHLRDNVIDSRDKPLLSGTEQEDLISCEIVDVTTSENITNVTTVSNKEKTEKHNLPLCAVSEIEDTNFHPPPLPPPLIIGKEIIPSQPFPSPSIGMAVEEALDAQKRQYIEIQHQGEIFGLHDSEMLQRRMLEEQEDTLRSSLFMMWDWQLNNIMMLNGPHYKEKPTDAISIPVSSVSPMPLAVEDGKGVKQDDTANALPPASSTITAIRDPITRFIFEWMHEYDEKKKEEAARKGFVELLHEASNMAEGKAFQPDSDDTSMTEADIRRRRLLLDFENTESSSWLSSTHPSSIMDDGLPRFVLTRSQHNTAKPQHTYRHSDENPSSVTTETTRYTNSSSMTWIAQEARNRRLSPPTTSSAATLPNTTTSTTVTTSSSSCRMPSSSYSEKPHLHDTMLRHLCQIPSLEEYQQQQGREKQKQEEYHSVEELRRQVERVQTVEQQAAAEDATHWGFANEQLHYTGPPVASLPLPQRPHWW